MRPEAGILPKPTVGLPGTFNAELATTADPADFDNLPPVPVRRVRNRWRPRIRHYG